VIRLVTQFDGPEPGGVGATPSGASSSCSCCSCCLATGIAASGFTAMHVRAFRLQRIGDADSKGQPARPWPELVAFFALPAAGGLAALVGWLAPSAFGPVLAAAAALWGVLLYVAYRAAGADSPVMRPLAAIFLTGLASLFELVIAAGTYEHLNAYLVGSAVFGLLVVAVLLVVRPRGL
jgi:hypothetical protein